MRAFDVKPIASMLELTASQLEVALLTAAAQVDVLAGSIATIATLGTGFQVAARSDPGASEALAQQIVEQTRVAMIAMQFHDQLVQRVAHVHESLNELIATLHKPSTTAVEWARVLIGIRARYTMEDERLLFDRIIGVAAGPAEVTHDTSHDSLRGSVELF